MSAKTIFISYSNKDSEQSNVIVSELEQKGILCWIAPRDIVPSADWAESIINAINNSIAMIVILSKNSMDSPQVKREVERAVNKGLTIIPLRLDNTNLSATMEYFLSSHHWFIAFPLKLKSYIPSLLEKLKLLFNQEAILVKTTPKENYIDQNDQLPNNAEAYYKSAVSRFNLKNYYGALEDSNKAVELNPNNSKVYNFRGVIKKCLEDYSGAMIDYNKSIKMDPNYSSAYFNRGQLKIVLSDVQGGNLDIKKADSLGHKDAKDWSKKFNNSTQKFNKPIDQNTIKKQLTIQEYTSIINSNPKKSTAYFNRGLLRSQAGDQHVAIYDYNKAIEINPNYAEAYLSRGNSKFKLGDKKSAYADWSKAGELGNLVAFELIKKNNERT